MKNKFIVTIILMCMLFGITANGIMVHADAAEPVEAVRINAVITVNDARMLFHAYEVNGRLYFDIFEIAFALSGTEKQFTLRWGDRNRTIRVISDKPYNAIGLASNRRIADVRLAIPVDINFLIDDEPVLISAYNISGETYFDLHMFAAAKNFSVTWNSLENSINIDTRQQFTENHIGRVIDPSKPMVALTFDDGPSEFTTPILDILERYGAVATFFVTGNRVGNYNDIILRAFEAGNEISSHSWSHRSLTRLSNENILGELQMTNDAVEAITGVIPVNMRPPFGEFNRRVINTIIETGMPIIMWSVDPQDWRTRNADITYDYILENVEDGDIILLHDLWEPTADAVVRLIPALIRKGFQLVTISELLQYSDITPVPGNVYNSVNLTR